MRNFLAREFIGYPLWAWLALLIVAAVIVRSM